MRFWHSILSTVVMPTECRVCMSATILRSHSSGSEATACRLLASGASSCMATCRSPSFLIIISALCIATACRILMQ
jgi:hypothetical protein